MELTPAQGRVLGALVEKERATPQAYPLTDNALLAACNQTTSRDPVVSYDTATVRMAVRELRELGLLRTVHRTGERSDKHRHELENALGLSSEQVALLAVLLLRGPQTLAELRSRSERLHAFASVDEVERELAVMADRDEPLVGLVPRQPGRKEARFGQLLVTAGADLPDRPSPGGLAGGVGGGTTGGGPAEAGGGTAGAGARAGSAWEDRPGADEDRPGGAASSPAPGRWASDQDDDEAQDETSWDRSAAASRGEDDFASPDVRGLAAALAEVVEEVADLRREVEQLRTALERATGG